MGAKNPFFSSLSLFTISSLLCVLGTKSGESTTYTVTTGVDTPLSYPGVAGSLRWAINSATTAGDTISFAGATSITLAAPLPPINTSVTLDGGGNSLVIGGNAGQFSAFFFTAGNSVFQNFSAITIQNCAAIGGAGGAGGMTTNGVVAAGGGGGGLGAGGAFFVGTGATVNMASTVTDLQINSCSAQGGNGGVGGGQNAGSICTGGGGGGGIHSIDTIGNSIAGAHGGSASQVGLNNGSGGGGGGGLGGLTGASAQLPVAGGNTVGDTAAAPGGKGSGPGGGAGGAAGTSANAGSGGAGGPGGATGAGGGGGGGGAIVLSDQNFGAGGMGGAASIYGGGGGGGGGSDVAPPSTGTGGAGGFGGGGGGAGLSSSGSISVPGSGNGGPGGAGGFGGGGGGGGQHSAGGTSVFGGGAGGSNTSVLSLGAGGGGGAALGGGVFVAQGGSLTLANISALSSSVSAGQGGVGNNGANSGSPGTAAGSQVFLMSGATLGIDIASDVTFAGSIASNLTVGGGDFTTGGLYKTGAGVLVLNGTNNYTGTTTIDGSFGGSIKIRTPASLGYLGNGSGGVVLTNAGELEFLNDANPLTINNPITLESSFGGILKVDGSAVVTVGTPITESPIGSGIPLIVRQGGTIQVQSGNTYSGDTYIQTATLNIPDPTGLGTGGSGVSLNFNSGTLQTNTTSYTLPQTVSLSGPGGTFSIFPNASSGITTTLSGQVTGTGAITVNGNNNGSFQGTLALSNLTNNYSGNTNITNGILSISNVAQLGASPNLIFSSGTFSSAGVLNLPIGVGVNVNGTSGGTFSMNGNALTINGQITGVAPLSFLNGTATLTNTTSNYLGAMNLDNATVVNQGAATTIGNSNPINFLNNSSLVLNTAPSSIPSAITTGNTTGSGTSLANFQLNGNNLTLSGTISDFSSTQTGGIQVTGLASSDTLTLSNTNNTYSGPTVISVGTLSIANPGSISPPVGSSLGSQLQFQAGTLQTTSGINVPNSVSMTGTGTIDLATNSSQLSGVISGSGLLNVINGGTLTLSGVNSSFSGGVNVLVSTLNISNGYNIGTGPLTLNVSTLTPTAPGVSLSNPITSIGTATFNVDMSNTLALAGAISGAGGVTKTGSNTLTLSASNGYSGNTNINGGTVSISNATTPLGTGTVLNITGSTLQTTTNSLALAQTITLAGGSTFDIQNPTTTLSGVVGGTGGLTKIGAGILSLTNANSYVGGTNINAGTAAISQATGLGTTPISISGANLETNTNSFTLTQGISLANGSTITVDGAITTTASGAITGTGGLTKLGTGELLLTTSANTYSGGTAVEAGTLAVAMATSYPTGTNLSISSGATFDMSAVGITSISVGNLENGTVLGGSLLLGANNIAVNGSSLSLFSGAISGVGGSLTQNGPAALSLLGNNTYDSGTTINSSTLSIIADHNLGASTGVVNFNGGTLEALSVVSSARNFNIGAGGGTLYSLLSQTLNAPTGPSLFTGTGVLTKTGPGRVNITGVTTGAFTGSVQVSDGLLSVNNALPVTCTVNAAGTLGGVGPIGNLINNGKVNPGNSIGTLNVVGNYTQGSGGELDIELNGDGTTDLLAITGTASLDGTLRVIPLKGPFFANGPSYTVLTAVGGLGGSTFATYNSGGLGLSLTYTPTSVILGQQQNHFFFNAPVIKEHNPKEVEEYLETLQYFQNGQPIASQEDLIGVIVDIATLGSNSKITSALNQLHPAQFGLFGLLNSDVRSVISSTLNKHAREECCRHLITPGQCDNSSVWIEPFGMRVMQKASGEQRGFESETGGLMLGGDYCFQNNVLLGMAVGGNTSYLKWTGGMGNAHLPSGFAAIYADWSSKIWYLEASVLGGVDFFRTNRHIHFTGVHRNAKSHHMGFDLNGHFGASVDLRAGAFYFEPFFNFDYAYLHQNGFTEHGANSLNLKVHSKDMAFMRTEEGVSFMRSFKTEKGCWSPKIWVSLVTSVPLSSSHYKSSLKGQPGSFTVWGYHKTNNRVAPGAELTWSINRSVALSAKYGAEFGKNILEQRADLRFEWNF